MTIKHLFPPSKPTLDLNFAAERELDPRVTFTRASTGTYVDSKGILRTAINDEPRFDHDGTGESLGLLIEESRTNYVVDNDQVMANRNNCTPTQTTGPDGVSTSASRLTAIASGDTQAANATGRTIAWSADVITTWSFYFNPANTTATTVTSGVSSSVSFGGATFEWSTLTATPDPSRPDVIGAGIVYVGSGWYRAWTNYADTVSSSTTCRFNVKFTAVTAGESIDVFGQMVEEGASLTSYIPTAGATATRATDIADITGTNFSSWYNQSEGTMFVSMSDGSLPQLGANLYGSNNNTHMITTKGTNARVGYQVSGTGSFIFYSAINVVAAGPMKYAYAYKPLDHALSVKGGIATQLGKDPQPNIVTLRLGEETTFGGNSRLNGAISRIAYYPRRLPDEQLQALTS